MEMNQRRGTKAGSLQPLDQVILIRNPGITPPQQKDYKRDLFENRNQHQTRDKGYWSFNFQTHGTAFISAFDVPRQVPHSIKTQASLAPPIKAEPPAPGPLRLRRRRTCRGHRRGKRLIETLTGKSHRPAPGSSSRSARVPSPFLEKAGSAVSTDARLAPPSHRKLPPK